MEVSTLTIEEIQEKHPGCYVQANDAGEDLLDVLVWASEEDSEGDDGSTAVARYLIRA